MEDYNNPIDQLNNDTSNSSEERTGNLSSLDSTNHPHNSENNLMARKLKANSVIESKYKGQPVRRTPDIIMRTKRFLK